MKNELGGDIAVEVKRAMNVKSKDARLRTDPVARLARTRMRAIRFLD